MKKIQVMKVVLICLAVLTVGFGILLADKMRKQGDTGKAEAEAAKIEATGTPTETPTPNVTATVTPVEATDAFTEVNDQIHIAVADVNLRAEPSSESEIIAQAPQGALYERIGYNEEWSKIKYGQQICYVSNDLITTEMPKNASSGVDDPEAAGQVSVAGSKGKIVIIDPGHQGKGDSNQEPIGPGTSETKARVTSGTSGRASGLDEYQLNLQVSLQLRDELVKRGYTVYMTREIHDVSISNKERAEFATAHNGDILVRIHANGSEDSSVNGALCFGPTSSNPFLSTSVISESQRLSQCIIDSYCSATEFANQGVWPTDEMSGINWSTMPVTIVEMGYMSNASDDTKMADPTMQVKMVDGISNGIDSYFGL